MQADVVVECRNVVRSFDLADGKKFTVLNDVNFTLRAGEFVVLIGPSGCGKSTLLNLIAGFDRPTAGTIQVGGRPVTEPGPEKAMVFQDYALLPWLNTSENVEIGLRLSGYSRPERREKALEMLKLVGLDHVASRPVYKLSGGMQQRVAIARALALEPEVLLLDEPFGALDAFQRAIMHRELLAVWEKTRATIIFVTHSLEEALVLGTRVVGMTPGAVGLEGEISVDLPRPRNPLSDDFTEMKRELFRLLTAHVDAEAFAE